MKPFLLVFISVFPSLVFAATAEELIGKVETVIVNPLIILLFAIAFLVFMWGAFKYVMHADDETERQTGGRAMLYGILGLFIMFSVFGIINLLKAILTAFK